MAISDKVERQIRQFIWGGKGEGYRCSLVKWEKVTQPKDDGGLGIRCLRNMNLAFMAKLGWRMWNESDQLWVRVVTGKYIHHNVDVNSFTPEQGSSNLWQGLVKAQSVLSKGIKPAVRGGNNTYFWLDAWLVEQPLINYMQGDISLQNMYKMVWDYWEPGVGWKWELITGLLPINIENKVAAFLLREDEDIHDELCWVPTNNGEFSVSSAYTLSCSQQEGDGDNIWKEIWKLEVPNRVRAFMWLVKHQRLMTNSERARRGFTLDDHCPFCSGMEETVEHVVRNCVEAKQVWETSLVSTELQFQQSLNFEEWLRHNLTGKVRCDFAKDWTTVFAITIWWLWRWRNDFVFNNVVKSKEYKIVWIKDRILETINAFTKNPVGAHARDFVIKSVRWIPPSHGWVKLNTDGSLRPSGETARGGGLVRDANGSWMCGFSFNIGSCDVSAPELWAVVQGLKLAWQKGFRRVVLETDSRLVFSWLRKKERPRSSLMNLVAACFSYLENDWEQPPLELCRVLEEDKLGVARPRRVPA
ncbi:hypothetical protein DITRI_Ditri04bG0175000 [Diplodiscus trichospermus]